MSTESEPFSLLICLNTTKFVWLSVFTLLETSGPKICSKSQLQKVYFQLMSVAQKRHCLSSLIMPVMHPHLLWNWRDNLLMTKSLLLRVKQIFLPSIISKVTSNIKELWETVRLTSFH